MAGTIAVHAAELRGIDALPVTVEASFEKGALPEIIIVGSADLTVIEAAMRVRTSLRASGYDLPNGRLLVSLSPAEVRKTGASYDLPIAIALLALTGQIPADGLDRHLFSGELSMAGVRAARGDASRHQLAKSLGLAFVGGPGSLPYLAGDAKSCRNISELRGGAASLPSYEPEPMAEAPASELDYADIVGHETAKHALVVAAVGGHGILMVGPPGAGKAALARRLPTILPPLSREELERAVIVRSAAKADTGEAPSTLRPFRAPHSSISLAGLVGGGRPVVPGELALADNGVLFLEDLQDFPTESLAAIVDPIMDGEVRIVRAEGVCRFPSQVQLIASALPCPCGNFGSGSHGCTCSWQRIDRYRGTLGRPLRGLLDMEASVQPRSPHPFPDGAHATSSAEMREQVLAAREFRLWREQRYLDAAASFLEEDCRLSGIGDVSRAARVARSIADLAEHEDISHDDVIEALAFCSSADQKPSSSLARESFAARQAAGALSGRGRSASRARDDMGRELG